jgi:hypothetical protein
MIEERKREKKKRREREANVTFSVEKVKSGITDTNLRFSL